MVAQGVDPRSVAFTAIQRAIQAFQISGPQEFAEQFESMMRVVALYTEAFALGVQFEATR